jgi:hypothetical protein
MSEPHDPIDEWLSADVELLRPSPGTFNRIHHTARRRKATRALSSVAGVAVVLAAVSTLPQVIAGLQPGRGGQPNAIAGRTTSPSTSSPTSKTSSPSLSPSPTESTSQAGAVALGSTGPTHPPAPGLRPSSVTFVGSGGGVVGAVLGQARCGSGAASCISMAGTPDYGHTWYKVGAPPAGPPDGAQGVSQVRFADTLDGWAYGPALFATHDGGLTWKKITVRGRVIDLAAMSGQAFAVVAYGCQGSGPHYEANCASFAMLSSPAQADHWRTVRGASTAIAEAPGGLALTAGYGYLMTKGSLYAGPVTGGPWGRVSASSSVPPCLKRGGQLGPWLLAPESPTSPTIFLVCGTPSTSRQAGSVTLYQSDDQGLTWQRSGAVTESGTPTSLAVAPTSGVLVLATSTGIYYTANDKSWHRASLTRGPAGGFSYIGMTTTLMGVAVPANSQLGEIFTTTDGGRTWLPSVIG